jgi:2,5-dihydroxypyridine 5,6-dioxygenase
MRQLPTSPAAATEIVGLFTELLRLSLLKRGETVLVYCDTLTPPFYPAAAMGAAQQLGAVVAQMMVPATSPAVIPWAPDVPESKPEMIMSAWKNADLVIDMITGAGQLYTPITTAALQSGTRVVRLMAELDDLRRMWPSDEVKARVLASQSILGMGRKLRVTSKAGTNLTLDKSGRPAGGQYGRADAPGKWAMPNSGQVACAPIEGSVEGILVLDRGDIILNLARYVADPVTLAIEKGAITSIEGGLEAFLLRDWFTTWKDPKSYIVSHIGWGCHHRASWHRMGNQWQGPGGFMDCESYYGNMQIAFGSNKSASLGGQNDSRAHIDIQCRNNSLWVDDLQVLEDGQFLVDELK